MNTLPCRFAPHEEPSTTRMAVLLSEMSRRVRFEVGHVLYEAFRVQGDSMAVHVGEAWSSRADAAARIPRIGADPDAQPAAALLTAPIETVTLPAV